MVWYKNSGERWAMQTYETSKRAALLFDKIYLYFDDFPAEISYNVPRTIIKPLLIELSEHAKIVLENRYNIRYKYKDLAEAKKEMRNQAFTVETFFNSITLHFQNAGYLVTPIIDDSYSFEKEYPAGDKSAYCSVIENIPDIIEDETSWEQILEFRKDRESIKKYRSFHLWLSDCIKDGNVNNLSDLLSKKLEDYEWALKKHGLKTTIGYLSLLSDWQEISKIAGASVAAAFIGGPVISILSAGLMVGSKVTIKLLESKIQKQDITQRAEIAYLYDINNKLVPK
jgi:hypothetical protein